MKRDMTTRGPRHARRFLPHVGLLGAAFLLTGGFISQAKTRDASAPQAGAASNTGGTASLPPGLELLDGPLLNPSPWQPEANFCDTAPKTVSAEACGKTYPATAHFAWSNCKPQPPGGHRPPPPQGDGQQPPPPPPDFGGMPPPPPGGPGGGPHGRLPPATSTGTVDLETTMTPVTACGDGAPMQLVQTATYDLRRKHDDGKGLSVQGTSSSTEVLSPRETAHSRPTTFDTTHTFTAADGTVERSVHLTGTLEVTHDGSTRSVTLNSKGALNAETSDRGKEAVTLTDIVRVPPHECEWPVSGTMDRTAADGSHHVLKFGPTCGSATIDGAALTLPAHPRGPHGPGGHGPGPDGQQPGINAGSTR